MQLARLAVSAFVLFAACGAVLGAELVAAVRSGDPGELERLLAAGADVDAAEPDGATALHWAVHAEDLDAARLLLAAGADATLANDVGATPLFLASINGNETLIELLLEHGADPNAAFVNGETPLMLAARTGRAGAIESLIAHGARVDAAESLRGTTALMWAAANANAEAVGALVAAGADVSRKSADIERGRGPYLAPTAKSRIEDFLRGVGQAGRAIPVDLDGDGEADREVDYAAAPDVPFLTEERIAELRAEDRSRGPSRTRTSPDAGAAAGSDASDDGSDETGDGEDAVEDGSNESQGGVAGTADGANAAAEDEATPTNPFRRPRPRDWGGLTPLVFAAREGDLESARILLEAGADVNQQTTYGWTALLTATQNRHYRLGRFLLEAGADPSLANKGGWTPLYIATDNRNVEGGDYPTRKPDMDHMSYIELLLEHGAHVNARMASSTETRTVFTHQWLREEGATPFLRAAQSGDIELMRLLLEHGADPSIATTNGTTPLMVASGIGWVEGVTYEWSPEQTLAVVALLLELAADVNAQDDDGRTALMGAAHKGRPEVVRMLYEAGADLAIRDYGSRDSIHKLFGTRWQAVDYADGLVRVGVQSATPQPETAAYLRDLMRREGLEVPPEGRTLDSICVVDICE